MSIAIRLRGLLTHNVSDGWQDSGMNQVHWTIEAHKDFDFASFLGSLNSEQRLALSLFLKKVMQFEELQRAPRTWIKPLGAGLFEFRIRETGILLRLFFTYRRGQILLLLAGYDKGEDPSSRKQQNEIAIARKRLKVG